MFDPAHEHVGSCSPCFKELTYIRRSLQRRKILLWAMGTTGTAILVFAVWLTYFRFQRLENPPQPQTVQSVQPSEVRPPVQPSGGSQATTPSPSVSPPEVKYQAALLDLRNASATRTVEPANPDPSDKSHEIPRGLLALTVQLPIGSENGSYEVQIRDSNQQAIQTTNGLASIENGITRLSIHLDTRSIQPGEYEFAWHIGDLSWRQHKIVIR